MIIKTDTREQAPWEFSRYGLEQTVGTLKFGDYTVEGWEDIFICERKASIGELYGNLCKYWKRFQKELSLMQKVKYRYILCEFPISDVYSFPASSSIPRKDWSKLRGSSKLLSKRIEEVISNYEIPIIFSGSKEEAEQKFIEIINGIK